MIGWTADDRWPITVDRADVEQPDWSEGQFGITDGLLGCCNILWDQRTGWGLLKGSPGCFLHGATGTSCLVRWLWWSGDDEGEIGNLIHSYLGQARSPKEEMLEKVWAAFLLKGVFIATQLNSTEATQLNWTELNSTQLTQLNSVQSVVFLFMTSRPTNWVNWVTTFIDRWQLFTLWTCRQLDIELSWVASTSL